MWKRRSSQFILDIWCHFGYSKLWSWCYWPSFKIDIRLSFHDLRLVLECLKSKIQCHCLFDTSVIQVILDINQLGVPLWVINFYQRKNITRSVLYIFTTLRVSNLRILKNDNFCIQLEKKKAKRKQYKEGFTSGCNLNWTGKMKKKKNERGETGLLLSIIFQTILAKKCEILQRRKKLLCFWL